jgi:hypothetical protein
VDTKQQMLKAIEELPDDAKVEDALERLYLLSKIERGALQHSLQLASSAAWPLNLISRADKRRDPLLFGARRFTQSFSVGSGECSQRCERRLSTKHQPPTAAFDGESVLGHTVPVCSPKHSASCRGQRPPLGQ